MIALAMMTSGGQWLSPDADQKWLARWSAHRGISHWWGWPAAAFMLGALAGMGSGPPAGAVQVMLLGVGAGWGSHIVGDFLFGRPHRSTSGRLIRGAGVPLWLGRGHCGVLGPRTGLSSSGPTAALFTILVSPGLTLWWVASWRVGHLIWPGT
jgi:hypothetical protein